MKKSIQLLSFVTFAVLMFTACSKTNKANKRFIKAGEWKVTELSVDGTNEEELPIWEISDCDPYKEVCIGKWENEEGGHSDFAWQFNNDGESFVISRQGDDHEHELEHADEEAVEQAYNFSGTYSVTESSKTKMSFTSTETLGFPGQTAVIVIEKK